MKRYTRTLDPSAIINKVNEKISELRRFGLKYFFYQVILRYFNSFKLKGNFLSFKETYEYIISSNKSVIRYGDGEILLLSGGSIIWQKYSDSLKNDLFKIISNYTNESPYLLCIPNHLILTTNKKLKKTPSFKIWLPFKVYYMSFFPKKVKYGNALIFRVLDLFSLKLEDLYKNKNVIFVANEKLIKLANIKTSKEIIKIIPNSERNSYFEKDELMFRISEKIYKFKKSEVIVLISCGPLAKILTYQISLTGYRAIDLGFMFEYSQHPKNIEAFKKFMRMKE